MKNTIDYKNLDNVAGGFEIANEEELKRLYEETNCIYCRRLVISQWYEPGFESKGELFG